MTSLGKKGLKMAIFDHKRAPGEASNRRKFARKRNYFSGLITVEDEIVAFYHKK